MRNYVSAGNFWKNSADIRWRQDYLFRKKTWISSVKNQCLCNLTEDDLIPKIKIDIPMPAAYADAGLIREFAVLEPFGKANIKPQFADKNLSITKAFVVGKNQNVLRLNLVTAAGEAVSAVYLVILRRSKHIMRKSMEVRKWKKLFAVR